MLFAGAMKFGLFGINLRHLANRDSLLRIGEVGGRESFESLWVAEHVVLATSFDLAEWEYLS